MTFSNTMSNFSRDDSDKAGFMVSRLSQSPKGYTVPAIKLTFKQQREKDREGSPSSDYEPRTVGTTGRQPQGHMTWKGRCLHYCSLIESQLSTLMA